MPDYLVKWKGQSSGPFSVEELRRMFEDREIGPMHEISCEGKWITARAFFRRTGIQETVPPTTRKPESAPPAHSPIPQPSHTTYASPSSVKSALEKEPSTALQTSHIATASNLHGLILIAGFWQRTMALLLDLLLVVGLPLWAIDAFGPYDLFTFTGLLEISIQNYVIGVTGSILLFWTYSALLECSPLHGTFGKRALGLIVIRQNGTPVTFSSAALRAIAKIGSAAMLLIGFFLAAASPRKLAFHDLVSGTAVVYPVSPSLHFS